MHKKAPASNNVYPEIKLNSEAVHGEAHNGGIRLFEYSVTRGNVAEREDVADIKIEHKTCQES